MLSLRDVFNAASIFLYVVRTAILIYAILSWIQPTFRFPDTLPHRWMH